MMMLEALREKTRDSHKTIEQNWLLSSLMSPTLTTAVYIEVLKKFYGFFLPLEKILMKEWQRTGLVKVMESRLKTPLLKKDLEFLIRDLNAIQICENLPFSDSAAKCFGILYVTEGSTLGGQMIAKAVKQSLGMTNELGLSFFSGYSSRTMSVWAETCKIIEQFAQENQAQKPQIVSAAVETFDQLHKWFEESGGENEH